MHQRQGAKGDDPQYFVGALRNSANARPGHTCNVTPSTPQGYRLLHNNPSGLAAMLARTSKIHVDTSSFVIAASKTIYITYSISFTAAHPWTRLLQSEPQQRIIPPWLTDQLRRYNFYLDASWNDPLLLGVEGRRRRNLDVVNNYTGEVSLIHLERHQMWLCASVSIIPVVSSSPHYVPRMLDPGLLRPRAFEEDSLGDGSHPSSLQHCIGFWPNGSKSFGDEDRIVRLTFTRWPTIDHYCLDIALEGSVYDPAYNDGTAGGHHPAPSRKATHRRSHKADILASRSTAYASLRRKWRHKLAVTAMTSYVGHHPVDTRLHTSSTPDPWFDCAVVLRSRKTASASGSHRVSHLHNRRILDEYI
ncbi:hypothetical protein BC628DRAFT_1083171 [Trametes gibbosa]|nr:hypothetical protein BC628DRAFT_1083171 [Trametes gibbosa]